MSLSGIVPNNMLHFGHWYLYKANLNMTCDPHHCHWNALCICYQTVLVFAKSSASIVQSLWMQFFLMEELNDMPLLCTYFHVRRHFTRFPSVLKQKIRVGSENLLPLDQYPLLMLLTSIIKIVGITFRVILIEAMQTRFFYWRQKIFIIF